MDKEFILQTKNGEIIHKVETEDIYIAIEFFAKTKNLSVEDLLKIYKVSPESKKDKN